MHAVCEGFDDFFSRWYPDIRRLCFAMTENDKRRAKSGVQNFLTSWRGQRPTNQRKRRKIPAFLKRLHALRRLLRPKLHRLPGRKALEGMSLPFPIADNLCVFLKLPLAQRGAFCLAHAGFSEAEIAKIAGKTAAHFACSSTPKADSAREAVSSILFDEDDADAMSDEIYARFAERSVGVENRIHDFRIGFDKIAPYLALAVLAIFAIAVFVSVNWRDNRPMRFFIKKLSCLNQIFQETNI